MKPFLVGLTGGFATGKTTVARMFKKLGAHVLDCDRIAHQAFIKGTPTYFEIVRQMSPAVCNRRGAVDRRKLGEVVFRDTRQRRKLERIVHPFVFAEIDKHIQKIKKGIPVLEVPLLFETGFDKKVDQVIVVRASRARQLERIRKKFHLGKQEAEKRIRAQWPLSRKEARADFVIDNTGTQAQTREQVKRLWKRLEEISSVQRKEKGRSSS